MATVGEPDDIDDARDEDAGDVTDGEADKEGRGTTIQSDATDA